MAKDIFQNPLERSTQSARVDTRPMFEKWFWNIGRPSNWENIRMKALVTGIVFPPLAPLALGYVSLACLSLWSNGGTLPIRLPIFSKKTDHSQTYTDSESGRPIYTKAGGIFYIGTVRPVAGVYDEHVGEQILLTNSDARTHFSYFGTTGAGKPQPVWTSVATPSGFRKLGDIEAGDVVCTPDGKTAEVSAIYDQGDLGVFELTFEDGRKTWASDEHVWNTIGSDQKEDQIKTIDIYEQVGSGLLPSKPVFVRLADVGEFEGKTCQERLSIIQSMMDKGATIRPNDILFTASSAEAATLLQNLVRSVGGKARRKKALFGTLQFVEIRHPEPHRLFGHEKLVAQATLLATRAPCAKALRVTSVKHAGREHCRCLAVASADHLYITDDFIVTHNTEAILSFCLNPLSWGSGFILTDGKAEVVTPNKVYALCRRLVREDDFRVLNFMNAGRDIWEVQKSESRYSNTFNPAARSASGQLTQLMVSLMPEGGSDPMWKGLAIGMIDAINRGLKYKQFKGLIEIDFGVIRDAIDLESVMDLCGEFDPDRPDGPLFPDLDPALIFKPLRAYLLNLPGFTWADMMHRPREEREISEDLNKQHNFRSMQFMRQLTMLCDAYGPVFKHLYPEVDMEDVVRMRRVLVVLLPSLGMSDEESEAVGKLVITSLRMMMAKALGDKVEGTYAELNDSRPTSSPAPFLVIMDEIGYFFAQGISVMYAQARSLGFSMLAAGQTLAPIYKDKIKHEAKGMLANAGCTFMGLMKDPDETSEYFTKLAGEALVSEGTGFEGDTSGSSVQYTDRFAASWNYRKRVEYAELSSMKEGESILVWKNRVIRVSNFYVFGKAKIPRKTPMVLNKLVPIVSPDPESLKELDCLVLPKLSENTSPQARMTAQFLLRYDAARKARRIFVPSTANKKVEDNRTAQNLIEWSEQQDDTPVLPGQSSVSNHEQQIAMFIQCTDETQVTNSTIASSTSSGGTGPKLEAKANTSGSAFFKTIVSNASRSYRIVEDATGDDDDDDDASSDELRQHGVTVEALALLNRRKVEAIAVAQQQADALSKSLLGPRHHIEEKFALTISGEAQETYQDEEVLEHDDSGADELGEIKQQPMQLQLEMSNDTHDQVLDQMAARNGFSLVITTQDELEKVLEAKVNPTGADIMSIF